MTGTEAAKKVTDKIEQVATRPGTPQDKKPSKECIDKEVEESQDSTSIYMRSLAIRTPERVRPPPEAYPECLESSPEVIPEGSELPASTAPGRMERHPKRRRWAN